MMDRRWLVKRSCVAGFVLALCAMPGCGGESADPDAPEQRRDLPKAPPFEGDSQTSSRRNHARGGEPFNDDVAPDLQLELPSGRRDLVDFAGAPEPPTPEAIGGRRLGVGPELHQPRARRLRTIPGDSPEPPLPGELAGSKESKPPAVRRRNLRTEIAALSRKARVTSRRRPSRPNRNPIPGEQTATPPRSSLVYDNMADDRRNAKSVESNAPSARDSRMADRPIARLARRSFRPDAPLGAVAFRSGSEVQRSVAAFDHSGDTPESRFAIGGSSLGEPQPATRGAISFAEASTSIPVSGSNELRPVPDAVQ